MSIISDWISEEEIVQHPETYLLLGQLCVISLRMILSEIADHRPDAHISGEMPGRLVYEPCDPVGA
ncbi:hypothetical protein [Methanospirillum lacunae]|uniref:Uncharacterized protein n=1 Tax=Methanospirillum lacunae TaxID=668570 RepID=A0A2V2N1J0_9EURY|nr:hypothetical protein [Methanospirillum lacunae]PWR71546.1 hypothetical protein DK846_11865 [Methanospirillum lacunae]